jgi:hypothetical protein
MKAFRYGQDEDVPAPELVVEERCFAVTGPSRSPLASKAAFFASAVLGMMWCGRGDREDLPVVRR